MLYDIMSFLMPSTFFNVLTKRFLRLRIMKVNALNFFFVMPKMHHSTWMPNPSLKVALFFPRYIWFVYCSPQSNRKFVDGREWPLCVWCCTFLVTFKEVIVKVAPSITYYALSVPNLLNVTSFNNLII